MPFASILFARPEDGIRAQRQKAPPFFADLHLDQIVDAITAGKEEYDLKPFFFTPLGDVDAIQYRHEVMRDLENPALLQALQAFGDQMRSMRAHLAQANKLHYAYQKESWFLDAVDLYGNAVTALARDLGALAPTARGFVALRAYLREYSVAPDFASLMAQTRALKADLATVQYCLLITGNQVTVRRYDAEADYSAAVAATFAKFQRGSVKDYRMTFSEWPAMNHVEAAVLERVARLYPEIFQRLEQYYIQHADYLDATIAAFDREIQFYIAYLEYCAGLRRAGLPFCYPRVSATSKEVCCYDGFDLALATKLTRAGAPVVCNDFALRDPERILVVTGPNQSGKTTFARAFGQLHYLASLGCPVPGRQAQLFLFDRLFTHFEREEDINNLRSRLEDDLIRIHGILEQSTGQSILIINEMFSSTTLRDAIALGQKILAHITRLDALCVYVTFVDELSTYGPKTVSMVGTVLPENPSLRTYKIARRPADGLAYALALAAKYRLTYERIKERIRP